MDVHFVGDLQRVTLSPTDRYVLTCDQALSQAEVAAIGEAWAAFVGGAEPKLLVIAGGKSLSVYVEAKDAE